jgi:hypothetical protein
VPDFEEGVCRIDIQGHWLDANGELALCIVQPPSPTQSALQNDEPRPHSVEFARHILQQGERPSRLFVWLQGGAGLLVFPEYAFGSSDFGELNELIADFPGRLIVFAGFGAVRGAKLIDMLGSCHATWPEGGHALDPDSRYNAGWCWLKIPGAAPDKYIFLKNFPEQRVEIALIPGLVTGTHILELRASDISLFPLLCSDLVHEGANSAGARIEKRAALLGSRRVLIAGLMYTKVHPFWQAVLTRFSTFANSSAGICVANQVCEPAQTVETDDWRSITGCFISRGIMREAPQKPLSAVKYVSTDAAAGLVVRNLRPGITFGRFRWVSTGSKGRNVWAPEHRLVHRGGSLSPCEESVEAQELRQYVLRRRKIIASRVDNSLRQLIEQGLQSDIVEEPFERKLTPRFWPRLLTGASNDVVDGEKMSKFEGFLDAGLAAAAAVPRLIDVEATTDEAAGQFMTSDAEIMLWAYAEGSAVGLKNALASLSINSIGKPLIVIAKTLIGHLSSEEIRSKRNTDVSGIRAPAQDITKTRERRIAVRNLAELENLLDGERSFADRRTTVHTFIFGP